MAPSPWAWRSWRWRYLPNKSSWSMGSTWGKLQVGLLLSSCLEILGFRLTFWVEYLVVLKNKLNLLEKWKNGKEDDEKYLWIDMKEWCLEGFNLEKLKTPFGHATWEFFQRFFVENEELKWDWKVKSCNFNNNYRPIWLTESINRLTIQRTRQFLRKF